MMFHSKLVRGAMLKLIIRQRVNVVSADLQGPQTPLYFAGAQLSELFPLLNLLGTESPWSWRTVLCRASNVMAVGDADVCPDIDIRIVRASNSARWLTRSLVCGTRALHPDRRDRCPLDLKNVACVARKPRQHLSASQSLDRFRGSKFPRPVRERLRAARATSLRMVGDSRRLVETRDSA